MKPLTVRCRIGPEVRAVELAAPAIPAPPPPTRTARMLALAYWIERAIDEGRLRDYAHAAKVLGVSRARVTQIVNLMLLDVATQEAILNGAEITERQLRERKPL